MVKSLAAGAMDAEFDWLVIARRVGFGDPESVAPALESEHEVPTASLPLTSSTPSDTISPLPNP